MFRDNLLQQQSFECLKFLITNQNAKLEENFMVGELYFSK